jgi:hypothetical protein
MLDPKIAGGENLPMLLRALEIPDDKVRIADQYTLMFNPYGHDNDGEAVLGDGRAAQPGDG